jgi:Cd2+/Zn2+-exporting ATPase
MAGCCSDEHKPEAVSKDVCCDPNEAIKCSSATASKVNAVAGSKLSSFRIAQMDCPTEQSLIQDKLSKLAGVDKLDFNLINRILGVWHNLPSTAPIEAAISSLGMQAEPLSAEGQARIKIEQMDCPTEEKLIRDKLSSLPGISELEFNLLQRVLTIRHTADALPTALAAIRDLGFTPVVEGAATSDEDAQGTPRKKAWWPLALSGLAAVSAEVIHFAELAPEWVVAGVALLSILLCGLTTYKKGWIALKNRNLNINALMSIAVTGAVLIGQWPEAAMVMFLFSVAELIEAKSLDRARNAIRGLTGR